MTIELIYITLTAILAGSLWIPYIIGIVRLPVAEGVDPNESFVRPADLSKLPAWIHRSHRAHLNLLEQFLPMAVIVLIANQLNLSNSITVWAVGIFFWLRVAHAIGMVSGLAKMPIRPMLFNLGWVCTMVMAWQVLSV